MADEEIVVNNNDEMETSGMLVPKFIKPETAGKKNKKPAYKSDIGLMVSFNPDKGLKIRVPAFCWDDEKRYGANTPLRYLNANLLEKVKELNDSDDEIVIDDFYGIRNPATNEMVALETGVSPVAKSPIVFEAIDYFMNDPDRGMNCDASPIYRANLHINKEKFQKKDKEELVPLNLGEFFGVITFEPGYKVHLRYDWNTPNGVPGGVRSKHNPKKIDCKKMPNATGFYLPVDFKDTFICIAFNKRADGTWELYTTQGKPDGSFQRSFMESKEGDLIDALKKHPIKFFEIYGQKTGVQEEIENLLVATDEVIKTSIEGGEYKDSDFISVFDENKPTSKKAGKKKSKKAATSDADEETAPIGEIIGTGTLSDEEEVDETPNEDTPVDVDSSEEEFK